MCRTVQHKLGQICVPLNPQRVVALSSVHLLDDLLTLGIKPIAVATQVEGGLTYYGGLSSEQVEGIESVGSVNQVSLEKILLLKPDLILGVDFAHAQIYEQLSKISPTVIVGVETDFFKEKLRYIAEIFGKEEKATLVLNQYQNRIEKLRKNLGNQLQKIEVSFLLWDHNGFFPALAGHISNEIFTDIGIRYNFLPSFRGKLSLEEISMFDADFLFIANYSNQKPPTYNLKNSLFSSLEAVKNNRVYIVDYNAWGSCGPSGVSMILDDLYKYLVNIS
jgi:iron complex transport system substrate-binding protein